MVGLILTEDFEPCGNGRFEDREECEINDPNCSPSCQCENGWEMNPCYWTIEGPTSVSPTDGSTVYPCRTICGNGFLDIEEECERIDVGSTEQYLANNSICIIPTWTDSLFGDKPTTTAPGDPTSKVYCSESC